MPSGPLKMRRVCACCFFTCSIHVSKRSIWGLHSAYGVRFLSLPLPPAHRFQWNALRCSRRSLLTREVIDPEEISLVESDDAEPSSASAYPAVVAAQSKELPKVFRDVSKLDSFARARIVNFVKRYSKTRTINSGSDVFETEELPGDAGVFHCRVLLPLQHPELPSISGELNGLWAHGVACTAKDAQLLASMHAEHIIDELGYHIYTLPSMQRKHAAAARKGGRWAPTPDEMEMNRCPSLDNLPLPLRRVINRDESENGAWQLIDLRGASFQSPQYALLSPCVIDHAAEGRIKNFFANGDFSLVQLCSTQREEQQQEKAPEYFVATIIIPSELLGFQQSKVTAQGKALTRETAITLACMHAELILDVVGVPVYQKDDVSQKKHAMTAWAYGRPAPLPGAAPKDPSHVLLPLPLKELPTHQSTRFSLRSLEEELVHCHRVLTNQITDFIDTSIREDTAIADLKAFLQFHNVPRAADPFFHECIDRRFKSTVILPLAVEYGVRGGIGIAPNSEDADVLAAMHALDVLTFLGIPVKSSAEEQQRWLQNRMSKLCLESGPSSATRTDSTVALPSPPGRRTVGTLSRTISVKSVGCESDKLSPDASQEEKPPPALPREACSTPRRTVKRAKAVSTAANCGANAEPAAEAQDAACRPNTDSVSGVSPSDAPEVAQKLYLDARARVPRECWNLTADSPDGYIMVAPTDPAERTQLENALYSPREADPGAKGRIRNYLSSVGRRMEDVFFTQYTDADDNGGLGVYKCAAQLPLPQRFGPRIALGEAATASDAENLAAMHAELILDILGVPLYSDAVQQRRHADQCTRQGRLAPFPDRSMEVPPDTASPPPLRREYVGSLHWEKHQEGKRRKSVSVSRNKNSTREGDTTSVAAASDGPEVDPVLTTLPEDVAFDIITESELDAVAKMRVQYYLRRRTGSTQPEITYRMVINKGTFYHLAEMQLPVPKQLGGECRVAGHAATKRDSEILCWMHAERTLDAMGVPLFDNLPCLQKYHAECVEKLGRCAPLVSDGKIPETADLSTAAPPPLRLSEDTPSRLHRPCPPTDISKDWDTYVDSCSKYIQDKKIHFAHAFLDMERVPRTGDQVYDASLDAAESQPLSSDAKLLLQRYCDAGGINYPLFWKSHTVGPLTHRVCLTSFEVPGHEYVLAQGVGSNKENSQRRAAMHAMALLTRLDADFAEHEAKAKEVLDEETSVSSGGISLEMPEPGLAATDAPDASPMDWKATTAKQKRGRRQHHVHIWDTVNDCFTQEGMIHVMELFTVCLDLPPPQVENLVRLDGSKVLYSTSITVVDENGRRWCGSGSGFGPRANSRKAYEELFHQLSRSIPEFKEVMGLVADHPCLNPKHVAHITFTDEQKRRIQSILDKLPESKSEAVAKLSAWEDSDSEPIGLVSRIAMTTDERTLQSKQLSEQLRSKLAHPDYVTRYAQQREKLAIFRHKREILDAVDRSSVVIICGTTGCGKTTQVPQYLLDHLTERGRGGEGSIVVTQPRRLSAVSIAQRVAAERLEVIGETCGYTIRFDNQPGRNINFCTSGILLRMLHFSPLLKGIQYLIIDEIHERDINSDFLLVLLRDLLRNRPDLRLILMSATLQAEQFGRYFDNAPIINVEGYVYPVQELFIEDLVHHAKEQKFMTPLLKEAAMTSRKDVQLATSMDWEEEAHSLSLGSSGMKYGFMEAIAEIDYATVQFAIEQAMRMVDLTDSSILVFLPGWEEITRAKEMLERNTKFHIISLHSSVGAEEQMQCFLPAPEGKTKLILSTNIAESGVTIDDVGAVIDLGRSKEKSFVLRRGNTSVGKDSVGSMSQLTTIYASRANCVQRRGRVGRTRPGVCIRLYSRQHFLSLHDFQTPEMLRTLLDSLCLQILSLGLGDPATFLEHALEPPSTENVDAAMGRLEELGAITSMRQLTPLGLRLASLPVEPKMGKIILMGAVLKCLDSALTIASVTQADVFISTREHRDAARQHREDLSKNTLSDTIASVNGFNFWATVHCEKSSWNVVVDLQERLLSIPQLLMISRHKRQFYEILRNSGFLGKELTEDASAGQPSTHTEIFVDKSSFSEDALNVGLVKCVVASGMFPNVAVSHGKRLFRNKLQDYLIPSSDSVVYKTPHEDIKQPFFVYNELAAVQEANKMVVRGLTAVPLWSILLMGTNSMPIAFNKALSLGVVDDWILFRTSFGTLELLRRFRRGINACLARKFTDPHDTSNDAVLEEVRALIRELVSTPLKPNRLVDGVWDEKGAIISPQLSSCGDETPRENETKEAVAVSNTPEPAAVAARRATARIWDCHQSGDEKPAVHAA